MGYLNMSDMWSVFTWFGLLSSRSNIVFFLFVIKQRGLTISTQCIVVHSYCYGIVLECIKEDNLVTLLFYFD